VRQCLLAALFLSLAAIPPARSDDSCAPYDLKARPLEAAVRTQLEFLGYVLDDRRGQVLGADAKPLSADRIEDYLQPFDGKTPLPDEFRSRLLSLGFRIDDSGLVLNPYTSKPVSNLELEYIVRFAVMEGRHAALERLHGLLSTQDPDKPLPREVDAQAHVLADFAGEGIPASFRKLLAGGKSADQARRSVEKLLAESTLFWDGTRSLADLRAAAAPVKGVPSTPLAVRGWSSLKSPPVLLSPEEKRLSRALGKAVADRLSRNPAGREILARLGNKLPPFLLQKLEGNIAAGYISQNRSILVNFRSLCSEVPGAPSGDIASEAVRFLLSRPEALSRFAGEHDAELAHELTHYWQDLRSGLFREQLRGNAPQASFIEDEQEAFLAHARYLHAQMLSDPTSAQADPRFPDYLQLLGGFEGYLDDVARRYLRNWPAEAATFQTALSLQKGREAMARRLMADDPRRKEVQELRLKGLALGTAEMERAQAEIRTRLERFKKDEYPRMRSEAFDAFSRAAEIQASQDDWNLALRDRMIAAGLAGDKGGRKAQEALDKTAEQALARLSRDLPPPYDRWIQAAGALESYYSSKGMAAPPSIKDAKTNLFRKEARIHLEAARCAKDPAARDKELAAARFWAGSAHDEDLLMEIDRLRLEKP
jgi:hypothetical protein